MTIEQFKSAVPNLSQKRAELYHPLLTKEFEKRNFSTRQIAHFLSQVGHESLSFIYTKEIWGPTSAQQRYEGRADLGNTQTGDGKKFLGRGLIQVTGRGNNAKCSLALFGDLRLLDTPELLEQPGNAVASAFWYWDTRQLSAIDDVKTLTKKINGGYNGLADRLSRFEKALKALT